MAVGADPPTPSECPAGLVSGVPVLRMFQAESASSQAADELEVKVRVLVHPIRLACTGKKVGPSLFHLMEVLGKERVLQRIDVILERL